MDKGFLVDMFNKVEKDKINIHTLMLLKDGFRVFRASAYGFDDDKKEYIYSISKSF